MRLYHTILLGLLFIVHTAHAFELIVIQAVSDTQRTFITRKGKRQGLLPGQTATFTAEDVSVIAKVIRSTGEFTQWELTNSDAKLPFAKGAIVTYYPATEYLWALAPESERQKYIKSQLATPKRSITARGTLTRGISESVSDAPANEVTRGSYMGEIYYEKDFIYGLAWDIGIRYERETNSYSGGSLVTQRNVLMADVIKYFDQLRETIGGRVYVSAGLGYGLSNTSTVGLSQTGPVLVLPVVKIGLDLPFNYDWSFLTDLGVEAVSSKEDPGTGQLQSTTLTNARASIGFRRYF